MKTQIYNLHKKDFFNLSTQDGLATLLNIVKKDPIKSIELSNKLIEKYKNIENIIHAKPEELVKIGFKKEESYIFTIIKGFELFYLKNDFDSKKKFINSKDTYNYIRKNITFDCNEKFIVVYLNRRKCLIDFEILFQGNSAKVFVEIKEIFKKAFELKARSLILIHNHPSGNIMPSHADRNITRLVTHTAENLDIIVEDHLIISEKDYFSAKDFGWVEFLNASPNAFLDLYAAQKS